MKKNKKKIVDVKISEEPQAKIILTTATASVAEVEIDPADIRKTIIFRARPVIVDMLNKLMKKKGAETISEIIRAAITMYYEKHFKSYGYDSLLDAPSGKKLSPLDKKEEKLVEICYALDGELIDKDGKKVCKYKTYEKVNPKTVNVFDQELPLTMLTADLITKQFYPSRIECEKTLEEINE